MLFIILKYGTIFLLFSPLVVFTPGSARADLYSWTDGSGTIHVTDSLEKVPSHYRSRAELLSRSPEKAPAASVDQQTDFIIYFEKNPAKAIFVDVLLNDTIRAKMLLDTGAGLVVVSQDLANRLRLSIDGEAKPLLLHTAGGDVTGRAIKLSKVELGAAVKEDVRAVVNITPNVFKGFDGLLGMSFLQDFKVVIDYTNNRLLLKKNCLTERCEEP